MKAAVSDPNFVSGGPMEGEFLLKAKQWGKAFGWDPEGLTSMEAFNALSKTSVMSSVESLGAGMSEGDRQFIVGQVPNLGYSKGGNLAIIEVQEKIQRRNMEVAKQAREYRKLHGHLDEGFDDKLAAWSELNPLFKPEDIERIMKIGTTPDPVEPPPPPAAGEDDWIEVPGMPGVKFKRGTTPPPIVAPVTPAPAEAPATRSVEPPPIVPPVLQPRLQQRAPQTVMPQPNPLRFR